MHADRGVFALLDAEGRLSPRAVVDRDGLAEPLSRIRMSRAIARRVLDERVAVVSEDVRADTRFDGSESLVLAPVRSFVAVPVLLGNAALGLLELSCHRPGEAWDEADIELLGLVASMAGSALRTKELARDQNAVIAQLEKVREELIRKQEQLLRAEQMATLGRFAARVAHEAKNHLMPLEVAQLLTERLPDDPEVAEIADLVRESREMLMEMLSEVLGYARGEARPLQKERAPLEPVVRSAARLLRWDEDVSPHTLEVEVFGDCPVDRDLRRLRQVIINLARNGAQAMGGQPGRLRLRVEATSESGIIEVIDDGPGIPPEVARSLFQPLFSTKGEKGVGIGLEISRRIVEEHQGTISFQRGPEGRGTAFRVWLPRSEG
jgi:signal transduction histidine kinase